MPENPDIFQESNILYEDNHLIIVNKKPSEIVQGDKTGDTPLSEKIKDFLKRKYDKPGNVFLGVAHRLDRPASGVLLFAKTSKALARVNEMIRERSIKKTYWAVVQSHPPQQEDKLVHYLIKNQNKNMSFAFPEPGKGRLRAELDYKVIGESQNYFLIEILLHTGRHHQIRVQLSEIGCPIKGDLKYGAPRSNKDASIHLHARKLELTHPVKKEPLTVIAPPPSDPLWDYFEKNFG